MVQTSGASPSAEKPFFRYDLQTTALEEGGHRYVDVSCPETGSSFRFFEVEYALACGMDGERDLSQLVDWAQSELDLRTNTQEVGAVLAKLNEFNFVEMAAAPAPVAASVAPAPAPIAASVAPAAAPAPIAAASGSDEVELGESGRSPLQRPRPAAPEVAEDLELGMAGASSLASEAPVRSADSGIELGAAGFEEHDDFPAPSREVSTDLSQTFRIDKDDVQAAVRASRIMSAVEVPDDLKDEMDKLDASDAAAEAAAPATENIGDDLEFQIGHEAKTTVGNEAIVLPEEPAKVARREAAEARAEKAVSKADKAKAKKAKQAPRRSASLVLWLLLLAAVGGGAAYYYMEYVREVPADGASSAAAQRAAQQRAVQTPVEPPAPVASLVVGEAPVSEIKAGQAGVVEEVVAPGTEVAESDVLIKLKGFDRYERDVVRNQTSRDQYAARLESAKAAGDAGKIPDLERNVARKEADIAEATAKRDAFFIKADRIGVVEALVEAGDQVKADQLVAKVTGQAPATVEFQLPAGVSAALEEEHTVVDVGDAELTATCKVTAIDGQAVTLSCPADSGFASNAQLKLRL